MYASARVVSVARAFLIPLRLVCCTTAAAAAIVVVVAVTPHDYAPRFLDHVLLFLLVIYT